MLVELLTTPRSRVDTARYWSEMSPLARPLEDAGRLDIVAVGDVQALRRALSTAGIAATVWTRMVVTLLDYRVDRVIVAARVRVRWAMEMAQMVEIATDLGVLVVNDDVGASPRGR